MSVKEMLKVVDDLEPKLVEKMKLALLNDNPLSYEKYLQEMRMIIEGE